MELKDFIKEVITSISEATTELRSDLADHGVIVTPLVADPHAEAAADDGSGRQVEKIEFDVAVTAVEPGAGRTARAITVVAADGPDMPEADAISRIAFSLAISFPPVGDDPAPPEPGRAERGRRRPRSSKSRKWTRF